VNAKTAETVSAAAVTIDDIRRAASVIAGHVLRTPAVRAPRLAEATGAVEVVLKLENQQYTGSFKDRGAYNKLASLDAQAKTAGVIAMSAGNHAQGVAYHAQRLGIPATIVMPEGTPFNKVERTASFGARVLIHGDSIDAAAVFARDMAAREGLTFVHPYDDPLIVAGQGTIGLEILEDLADVELVLAPIGGGGLISGVATAIKESNPKAKIIGVEPEFAADAQASLRSGKIQSISGESAARTAADGLRSQSVGEINFEHIRKYVDGIVTVTEDEIQRAMRRILFSARLLAEPSGAVTTAAAMFHAEELPAGKTVAVLTGGNIEPQLFSDMVLQTV